MTVFLIIAVIIGYGWTLWSWLMVSGKLGDAIDTLRQIEQFGHGRGHGHGYTCANMAEEALKELE